MGDAMAAAPFTKFDPFSFLENSQNTGGPAKPAKVAKVLPQTDGGRADTLAPLAALAELHPVSQNLEIASAELTDSLEGYAALFEHDAPAACAANRQGKEQGKADNERPYEGVLAALCERCPDLVEEHRWREATADSIAFVTHWGVEAAALGWTARDLLGLADVPDNPGPNYRRLSRYDQTGLIWMLQGRRVVALTKTTALIETANGTVAYRRYNKPALGPLGDSLDDFARGLEAVTADNSEVTT
jgi:hypothetical protein